MTRAFCVAGAMPAAQYQRRDDQASLPEPAAPNWVDFTPEGKTLIKAGSYEIAAGRYYDEEEMDAWLDALEADPDAPMPIFQQRSPS